MASVSDFSFCLSLSPHLALASKSCSTCEGQRMLQTSESSNTLFSFHKRMFLRVSIRITPLFHLFIPSTGRA